MTLVSNLPTGSVLLEIDREVEIILDGVTTTTIKTVGHIKKTIRSSENKEYIILALEGVGYIWNDDIDNWSINVSFLPNEEPRWVLDREFFNG